MSNEIIKVLDYIAEKTGIVIDYSKENILPQVMEVLARYRTYEIVICSVFFVALIAVSSVIATIMIRWWKKPLPYCERGDFQFMSVLLGIAFAVFLYFILDGLLQWIFVPEIQYIELLKGFMEG